MTALLGLLAVAGYQNREKIAEILKDLANKNQAGAAKTANAPQGQLGGLGDLLGGATVGGLLNSGLGELMKQFDQKGMKDTVDSWIGTGPNRQIAPPDLKTALGPEVIQAISKATGISEQDLLKTLSQVLPQAVDKYTPDGKIAAS
ncbi:MAG: YidB family protein [Pseudorhodoplanes sp.]